MTPAGPAAPRRGVGRLRRRAALAAALALAVGAGAAAAAPLPAVIAAARPAVLPVGTFNVMQSPRFAFRGSGFAVGDGTRVVTAFHVLPEAGATGPQAGGTLAVLVPRAGGGHEPRPATLLHADRTHDLALLQIEGSALPVLALADDAAGVEGLDVVLLGYPLGGALGYTPVTHRGIISSITALTLPARNAQQLTDRAALRLREGTFDVYQLDANAFPGNSGGPLLDADNGQVVGVISMVVRGWREASAISPSGITYAVPVRFVRELLSKDR